jgi:hypothetical protein
MMDLQLPYATAVPGASTAWRLRRPRSQASAKGAGAKVYLVRLDGAERLLSHMTPGSLVLRSQTVAKGSTPVFVSYRIRSSVHHQKVQSVAASWKLSKNGGVPQCLLDSQALAVVQTLQNSFLPAMGSFLRQVASHRHFIDKDLSAISVRLELQYREFLICRSARHQLLVCTLDADKATVKSLIIRIDCTSCQLICRDSSGSEHSITMLDEALSRLLGRDTSRDAAHKSRDGNAHYGAVEIPAPGSSLDQEAPSHLIAKLRTAIFESEAGQVAELARSILARLRAGGAGSREAFIKDGALEPVVHALLNSAVGHVHQERLRGALELLMAGDHNTNLDVSTMMTAKFAMCSGDDRELVYLLEVLNSLLSILPFRRACARNNELLSYTCRLHDKKNVGRDVRLDGAVSLRWNMRDPAALEGRHDGCKPPTMTQRSMLSDFDRCSSIIGRELAEPDSARTAHDTGRSDWIMSGASALAATSSSGALPRLAHAPLPAYSPSREYSSLSARAHVDEPDQAQSLSPHLTPRSPRAATFAMPQFLSPPGADAALDERGLGSSRHVRTDSLSAAASRTPCNIPKLRLMSVAIAESPMQTRSSRRQLTLRGLPSLSRGPSTPGPFSPHTDILSRSTTLRDVAGPALASFREEAGAASPWQQLEDPMSSRLVGGSDSAEDELRAIARSVSRAAVAANLAAIAAQRRQMHQASAAGPDKELSPLPPPTPAGQAGAADAQILLLLLQVMAHLFAEPAAGLWLEQQVNLLYTGVFALLKSQEAAAASDALLGRMMDVLRLYQERVEGKLLAASDPSCGTAAGGVSSVAAMQHGGSSRRRVDSFLWRLREQLLALSDKVIRAIPESSPPSPCYLCVSASRPRVIPAPSPSPRCYPRVIPVIAELSLRLH